MMHMVSNAGHWQIFDEENICSKVYHRLSLANLESTNSTYFLFILGERKLLLISAIHPGLASMIDFRTLSIIFSVRPHLSLPKYLISIFFVKFFLFPRKGNAISSVGFLNSIVEFTKS